MEKYKVSKCRYWDNSIGDVIGWQILRDGEELFWVNMWLGRHTSNTAKQYAYKLSRFLNFLLKISMEYIDARENDLDRFITELRYKEDEDIFNIGSGKISHSSIRSYVGIIVSFYSFISIFNDNLKIHLLKSEVHNNKNSFLYNIVWTKNKTSLLIDKNISRYKPKKQYIKWYSDREIEAILQNFNTFRDKAIFLMSLCGMRIDEILSLRILDYNQNSKSVITYKSKGKRTGDTNRAVSLDRVTINMIESYLSFERMPVELELLDNDFYLCQEMFIGIKHGPGYGKALSYAAYRYILKRAAKGGRVDQGLIRTHSGRSTAVMRDILFHSEHPEILSLDDIRIKHGWADLSSMEPYLDTTNPKISMENRKLLDKVRKMHKEKLSERKD